MQFIIEFDLLPFIRAYKYINFSVMAVYSILLISICVIILIIITMKEEKNTDSWEPLSGVESNNLHSKVRFAPMVKVRYIPHR
jgi:hypothetical protein